jgi:hypothetical protein
LDQERNVEKRFSRERFGFGRLGNTIAILVILAVIVWLVYTTGFLPSRGA